MSRWLLLAELLRWATRRLGVVALPRPLRPLLVALASCPPAAALLPQLAAAALHHQQAAVVLHHQQMAVLPRPLAAALLCPRALWPPRPLVTVRATPQAAQVIPLPTSTALHLLTAGSATSRQHVRRVWRLGPVRIFFRRRLLAQSPRRSWSRSFARTLTTLQATQQCARAGPSPVAPLTRSRQCVAGLPARWSHTSQTAPSYPRPNEVSRACCATALRSTPQGLLQRRLLLRFPHAWSPARLP